MSTTYPPYPPSTDLGPSRATPHSPTISPRTQVQPTFPPDPRISPVLQHATTIDSPENAHLQFAELLTPLKLRKKRKQVHQSLPSSAPYVAGPSQHGYYTMDGELYRGASQDPTLMGQVEEDAITIGGSSSSSSDSSSSVWSWGSGNLERGRRATMAVFGRVGEALGVRRGSDSSTESESTGYVESLRRMRTRRRRSISRRESVGSEKGKFIPVPKRREFMLLVPPGEGERVTRTPVLDNVLERIREMRLKSGSALEPTLPDIQVRRGGSAPGRTRQRPNLKGRGSSFANPPIPRPLASRNRSRLDQLKGDFVRPKSVSDLMGMSRPSSTTSLTSMREEQSPVRMEKKGCWWLDVSCPGWEDLRDIGELLGLHPLSLEDVLQQDPREKFDVFDKLGYYFLVIRAVDEGYFRYTPGNSSTQVIGTQPQVHEKERERRKGWGMGRASGKATRDAGEKVEIVEDPGREGLEGVGVGGSNVYLVVFGDGIVSLHYDDISKHTERVLERLLNPIMTSEDQNADWIAHGLIDSIVDAFFPLIRFVDGEVDDIDSLTIDPSTDPKAQQVTASPSSSATAVNEPMEKYEIEIDEKMVEREIPKPPSKRFLPKRSQLPRPFLYLSLFFLPTSDAVRNKHKNAAEAIFDRSTMLTRITEMRRLVTGLSRLLGAKHQVVGRLRKRASEGGGTIAAYLGDVEDHILLLQTSLYHYEYILSHCQPAYLSHLSVSFSFARGGTDQAILALSTVTISILPMQVVLGIFSMNVHVPANGSKDDHVRADGSPAPYWIWMSIVFIIFVVLCGMVTLIRWWRYKARVKWNRLRGEEAPRGWEAYWGFE